ncbi:unnamed protein product [Gadus morhua 'NCC']
MLGTLCSLLAALTCVSAVTVVTQQPSVVTLTRGETASIDCNLGSMVAQCEAFMTNRFITFSHDRLFDENLNPSLMDTNVNCAAVTSTNVKHLTVNTETGH